MFVEDLPNQKPPVVVDRRTLADAVRELADDPDAVVAFLNGYLTGMPERGAHLHGAVRHGLSTLAGYLDGI